MACVTPALSDPPDNVKSTKGRTARGKSSNGTSKAKSTANGKPSDKPAAKAKPAAKSTSIAKPTPLEDETSTKPSPSPSPSHDLDHPPPTTPDPTDLPPDRPPHDPRESMDDADDTRFEDDSELIHDARTTRPTHSSPSAPKQQQQQQDMIRPPYYDLGDTYVSSPLDAYEDDDVFSGGGHTSHSSPASIDPTLELAPNPKSSHRRASPASRTHHHHQTHNTHSPSDRSPSDRSPSEHSPFLRSVSPHVHEYRGSGNWSHSQTKKTWPTPHRHGSPSSTQYSPKGRTPPRFRAGSGLGPEPALPLPLEPEPAPLVLLHVTLLPLRWPWSSLLEVAALDDLSEAARTVRESWRLLQDRMGDTVRERGVLLPHPQNDYEVLEERLLEAMDLPLRRRARILECGHYLGPANVMTMDEEAAIAAAEKQEADEADEANEDSMVSVSSTTARPLPPKTHWCLTCRHDIRYESLGPGKAFRVTVYASNGLMRAGAWEACWREMERVDVEIVPLLDAHVHEELERLSLALEAKLLQEQEQEQGYGHGQDLSTEDVVVAYDGLGDKAFRGRESMPMPLGQDPPHRSARSASPRGDHGHHHSSAAAAGASDSLGSRLWQAVHDHRSWVMLVLTAAAAAVVAVLAVRGADVATTTTGWDGWTATSGLDGLKSMWGGGDTRGVVDSRVDVNVSPVGGQVMESVAVVDQDVEDQPDGDQSVEDQSVEDQSRGQSRDQIHPGTDENSAEDSDDTRDRYVETDGRQSAGQDPREGHPEEGLMEETDPAGDGTDGEETARHWGDNDGTETVGDSGEVDVEAAVADSDRRERGRDRSDAEAAEDQETDAVDDPKDPDDVDDVDDVGDHAHLED